MWFTRVNWWISYGNLFGRVWVYLHQTGQRGRGLLFYNMYRFLQDNTSQSSSIQHITTNETINTALTDIKTFSSFKVCQFWTRYKLPNIYLAFTHQIMLRIWLQLNLTLRLYRRKKHAPTKQARLSIVLAEIERNKIHYEHRMLQRCVLLQLITTAYRSR